MFLMKRFCEFPTISCTLSSVYRCGMDVSFTGNGIGITCWALSCLHDMTLSQAMLPLAKKFGISSNDSCTAIG